MASERGNELARGSVDLMVLSVLADGPLYGYLIQQRLSEATRGLVRLPAGTLYPLLHRLELARWVKARVDKESGRERKWYELTAAGRRRLHSQARQWQQLSECLGLLLAPVLKDPEPA